MLHLPALRRRDLLVAGGLATLFGRTALAQATPRFLVAAAAGGATDLLTRVFAQWLGEEWGRPCVVENRPGAGGLIATQALQKAPADGNTLMLAALSHVANLGMMESAQYDPVKDFTPIAKLLNFASVLVVNPAVPARTMKEFIAYAKANPGKLNWGLGATGTSQHLAGVMLAREAGIQYATIPYKGGGPAMNDLLAGQVHFMIESIPTARPHIQSGKIRALGVTGGQRSTGLPDVPTIAEAALPGFDVQTWFALMGPAGLPADFVQSTYQHLQTIMARPVVREKLLSLGAQPELQNPAQTKAFIEAEARRWLPIIKEAGIKV
ncbi:Bug family tripartite tricarboxylate transporter substrate binding protein [Ramlibacter algicola]|uniref:Tripartite tricarboxylate transporter substrate binding protein n=1 Tax=Ramlibacter algicola TaxID=2795217 RepID=A0A934Q0H6_9BURK|nr:tripartite tricarboxylate transporter substrate binding protein [Ramlibacter algicola]MBK0392551.1 tripartite tricarboxylate transporter substrate binding protein [Ramlibacter algicola]